MPPITDGAVTSIALCWRIERRDGGGLALTSHDQTVTLDRVRYEPSPGMVPAAVTRKLGIEPATSEAVGSLSSASLSEEDLVLGRWDGARVMLHAVDWTSPDNQPIELLRGDLGEIAMEKHGFSADLHGAAARLADAVCPATSPECRAELGDRHCRVDLAGRTIRANALAANGNLLELDQALDGRFLFGRLRYLSGANCGLSTIILGVEGAGIQVRDVPRAEIESGCVVELREGCDKRFETCVSRFANAENFRGEPHLPGNDLLTRYPGG